MATVNITVENDADFYRMFQYQTTEGTPIDITGALFHMMLRRKAEDEAAVLLLSTEAGDIPIVDALQGMFSLLIRQTSLEQLGTGDFAQSLIMRLGGFKRSVWSGKFTNKAGPSR